jgi:hypothetical protein
VAEELATGGFRDPAWVERWEVAFAGLYLDAVEAARAGRRPPEPWAVAFGAGEGAGLPPLRHGLLADRRADHEHIDQVLVARVGAEDTELEAVGGPRSRTDRLLQPLNRLATRRFLRESRAKGLGQRPPPGPRPPPAPAPTPPA